MAKKEDISFFLKMGIKIMVAVFLLGVFFGVNTDVYADETEVASEEVLEKNDEGCYELEDIIEVAAAERVVYNEAKTSSYDEAKIQAIVDAIESFETSVNVYDYKITTSEYKEIYALAKKRAFLAANASGINNYSYMAYSYSGGYIYNINFKLGYSKEECIQRYNAMDAKVNEIISKIPKNFTDEEKVLFVHDYIVYECEYDFVNYENNTIPDDSYSAYGCLVLNTCVCQGYSDAYEIILSRLGIESEEVPSASLGHVWNLVNLDGEWYHVDVTWDDTAMGHRGASSGDDMLGLCNHNNFLVNDAGIKEAGHNSWDDSSQTSSSSKYMDLGLSNVVSRAYYINNKWYYIYNYSTTQYLNQKLCSGDVFNPTATSTPLVSTSDKYDFSLGYYDGRFYYFSYFNGNIQSVKVDGSDYKNNIASDIGISEDVVELAVRDDGLMEYVLYTSGRTSYQLPKTSITLNAPVAYATSKGSQSATLTWQPVEGATSYQLYKYFASTDTIVESKVVTETSYTFYGLSKGKTYRYIVQAICDNGKSDNVSGDYAVSVMVGKTLDNNICPTASYTYDTNCLILSWDAKENVNRYYVYKYYMSSKKLVYSKTVKTNQVKFFSAVPGKSYRYLITDKELTDLTNYNGKDTICVNIPELK